MKVTAIKPDPDQPRRTFNPEKMQALEASMRDDGFRPAYPIIINGGNIIVDGERRWRAAKKVGIKEVPVEIRKDITKAERLMFQLQSEGAELEFIERNKAWVKLWELSQDTETKASLARKLGVSVASFKDIINRYYVYQQALGKLTNKTRAARVSYDTLVEVGKEDKEVVEKAVKEKWTRDKTREIKKAIEDKPLRRKQILEQDYSDDHEGSIRWKLRLEVAKSDVDIDKTREIAEDHEKREETYAAYDQMLRAGFEMVAAMKKFDYTEVAPQTRVKLHRALFEVVPFADDYFKDLAGYMIEQGELVEDKKKLK